MGSYHHKALIVTAHASVTEAYAEASRLCENVTIVTPPTTDGINGFSTFMIAPCGSKVGWSAHEEADHALECMVSWLNDQRHEDGSSPYAWVLVGYGRGEGDACVAVSSDRATRIPRDVTATTTLAEHEDLRNILTDSALEAQAVRPGQHGVRLGDTVLFVPLASIDALDSHIVYAATVAHVYASGNVDVSVHASTLEFFCDVAYADGLTPGHWSNRRAVDPNVLKEWMKT